MMERRAVLLAVAAALSFGVPLSARADCMCAANGTRYEMGAVVCIQGPSGNWLGRCGKVLNNSSWTRLTEGCPLSLDRRGDGAPLSRPVEPHAADLPG